MFMTYETFENPIPAPLLPPGAKSWRALELSLRLPWFLACIEDPEEEFLRDLLLASESDLASLILESPQAIKRVEMMEPSSSELSWRMRKINRIWKKAESSGFTQWIFEHDDGSRSFCPPCSEDQKCLDQPMDHVLDLA